MKRCFFAEPRDRGCEALLRKPGTLVRHGAQGALRWLLMLALALAPGLLNGQEEEEIEEPEEAPRSFFLPSNPVAAAYVLGRLSNEDLIAAPRSEFVYVALLQRAGLDRQYRIEAVENLAKLRGASQAAELVKALGELDRKGEDAGPVLQELSGMLLRLPPAELSAARDALKELAAAAALPLTRQIAFAGLVTIDGSVERAWEEAESDEERLADLLRSIEMAPSAEIRANAYSKAESVVRTAISPALRSAAMSAMASAPGHEPAAFNALAGFVESGRDQAAAVSAISRIPRNVWAKDAAEPLLEALVGYLGKIPLAARTGEPFVEAFRLASDLASLLPEDKATAFGRTLRGLGPSVFVIRTLPERMLFDKTVIVAEAGKPVEIVLVNDDAMQHNLVVLTPGPVDEIGMEADQMAPEPDAQGRLHVPDSPRVLHATPMLNGGETVRLAFNAPEETGEYPYVCTYPGHWRLMAGTMIVVRDVDAYVATQAAPARPAWTDWNVEELAPHLAKIGPDRNLARGKEIFTKLACASCHKFDGHGTDYGPDLTDTLQKRYTNDRADLLRHILEPGMEISDRYKNYRIALASGEFVTGMIVREDAGTLAVQTGPSEALIRTLNNSEVRERELLPGSLMPPGLLGALSEEQILDLLAYLEFGNKAPMHPH